MELYAGNSNNDALVETDTSHQQQNVLGKEPLERCTTAIFVTTDFASELSIGGCYQRRITSSRHSDPLFTKARSYYRGLSVDREQDRIAILGSSQYQEIGGGARWTIGVPHTQEVDSSFSIDEDTAIVCTAPVLSPTTVNTWICEIESNQDTSFTMNVACGCPGSETDRRSGSRTVPGASSGAGTNAGGDSDVPRVAHARGERDAMRGSEANHGINGGSARAGMRQTLRGASPAAAADAAASRPSSLPLVVKKRSDAFPQRRRDRKAQAAASAQAEEEGPGEQKGETVEESRMAVKYAVRSRQEDENEEHKLQLQQERVERRVDEEEQKAWSVGSATVDVLVGLEGRASAAAPSAGSRQLSDVASDSDVSVGDCDLVALDSVAITSDDFSFVEGVYSKSCTLETASKGEQGNGDGRASWFMVDENGQVTNDIFYTAAIGTWSVRNVAIGVACTSTSDSDDPTSIDVAMWECDQNRDGTFTAAERGDWSGVVCSEDGSSATSCGVTTASTTESSDDEAFLPFLSEMEWGIILGVAMFTLLCCVGFCCRRRRKKTAAAKLSVVTLDDAFPEDTVLPWSTRGPPKAQF